MDEQHLFDALLQAAEKLGVEVRMEPFETPATTSGGLCLLRGERLVLIDQRALFPDRVLTLARALAELESETVYIVPEARELIEAIRKRAGMDRGREHHDRCGSARPDRT
jgi:beta-phosphoglucomutase-like phosphatase (HAD superfamily)